MRYVLGAVIVMTVVAGRAHAQSSAIAEQLFNEARELGKQGRWREACPKFEASLKQDPALGTRLNLATCYEKIGKLASAWGTFRESAELARKANDSKRADYAQHQAALLEPRLPKLTINAPAKAPAGLVVQRDGTPVNAAELGLALYVDPGAHEITASAPGFEPFKKSITVDEAKIETLTLPELAPKPDGVKDNDHEKEPEPPVVVPASPTTKYIGLGLGGAGLVAVGVGLVFGSQAISKNNKAEELCPDGACSPQNFDEGQKLIKDGRSKATLSTVLVAGGGAAIAAGAVVYFFLAPRSHERPTSARIVPILHDSGGGVGVAGRF